MFNSPIVPLRCAVAPDGELAFDRQQLRALDTTRSRAKTLLEEGYKIEPTTIPGIYFCRRPTPRRIPGGTITGYEVNLLQADTTCTCEQFANCGDCKHRIAVLTAIRDALHLVAPLLGGNK